MLAHLISESPGDRSRPDLNCRPFAFPSPYQEGKLLLNIGAILDKCGREYSWSCVVEINKPSKELTLAGLCGLANEEDSWEWFAKRVVTSRVFILIPLSRRSSASESVLRPQVKHSLHEWQTIVGSNGNLWGCGILIATYVKHSVLRCVLHSDTWCYLSSSTTTCTDTNLRH